MIAFAFTKTIWAEPPRIRHDLTRLLINIGFTVYFFEKPKHFWSTKKGKVIINNNLILIQNKELLHHQLRPFSLLSKLNEKYESKQLNNYRQPDVIFNFNYDYYWLRKKYPGVPIITVINDDFLAVAKFLMRFESRRVEEKTVKNSDVCITVSSSLLNKCLKYNKNSFLFLPWAAHLCKPRERTPQNKKLLYWGHINNRVDFKVLEHLSKNGIQIDMYGPFSNRSLSYSNKKILRKAGINILGPITYENLSKISDCYYATILPYRSDIHRITLITMSNRGFKLLSLGLPLIYNDFPYLINASQNVIWKCKTKNDFLEASNALKHIMSQDTINTFLISHLESNRKDQLIQMLKLAGSNHNTEFQFVTN